METSTWIRQVEGELKELAAGTDMVRASSFFKEYLDAAAVFWQYSWHNQILIRTQNPRASRVAGFRAWSKLGRWVKKGEKGIRILAPRMKTAVLESGKEEVEVVGFFPVCVFDVCQTEGKPLPGVDVEVKGADRVDVFERLLAFSKERGIVVEFGKLGYGIIGASSGGRIVVDSSQELNGKVGILLHELAHELLHRNPESKAIPYSQKEIQAEGTAFVVGKALGLETKSFDYLALYDVDYEKIMGNLKTISEASKVIVSHVLEETI